MAELLVPKQAARIVRHNRGKWHLPKPWRYEDYAQIRYEEEHNGKTMIAACGRVVNAQSDLAEGWYRETANVEDIWAANICKACLGPIIVRSE